MKNQKRLRRFCVLITCLLCLWGCKADKDIVTSETISDDIFKEDSSYIEVTEKTYKYPLVIEPSSMTNIEFCIESEDILLVGGEDGFGYINKSGEELTGYLYEYAYPFSEGFAAVCLNGKYGFIDVNAEPAIEFVYDDLSPFSEGVAYYAKDEEYGFLKKDGSVAFTLDCDSVSSFKEGKAFFSIDGKYGYIDKSGKNIIDASFSDADYFENDLAFVSVDGYKGAINPKGEIIIPLDYDELERKNGYIVATKNDEEIFYAFDGKELSKESVEKLIKTDEDTRDECEFTTQIEEDRIYIYDKDGLPKVSFEADIILCVIYGDDNSYLLMQMDSEIKDKILILKDNKDIDLSKVLLKNSITPKKRQFMDIVKERKCCDMINLYVRNIKYYDLDYSGKPVLYYHAEDVLGKSISSDSLFTLKDGKITELLSAEETGGTLGGDTICFFKEKENGQLYIGLSGIVSGFGGVEQYMNVYKCDNKVLEELLDVRLTYWFDEEKSNEYFINNSESTEEEYFQKTAEYGYFWLF